MTSIENPAIPRGSTVLVTGANGLVGSNISKQFLHYGYKVRGAVRDAKKSAWLTRLFNAQYGEGNFELVIVPDMVAAGAFEEAVKGVSAVVHTASVMSLDPDPNKVIPDSVAGAVNALKAAYAEASVKRFVFTSSSTAAVRSDRGKPAVIVTEDTWNDEAVEEAWAPPPYGPERAAAVYCASKTQAEKEIWKYHKENRDSRPDLVVNTVLANMNYGKTLDLENQGYPSSAGFPVSLWKGEVTFIHHVVAPQYYINTADTGRLHVAATILSDVKDERIFGFAGRFSWDQILEIFRRHYPQRTLPDNFSGGEDPNEIKPRERAEQLLRELGRPGWVSLEQAVLENVEDLVE